MAFGGFWWLLVAFLIVEASLPQRASALISEVKTHICFFPSLCYVVVNKKILHVLLCCAVSPPSLHHDTAEDLSCWRPKKMQRPRISHLR